MNTSEHGNRNRAPLRNGKSRTTTQMRMPSGRQNNSRENRVELVGQRGHKQASNRVRSSPKSGRYPIKHGRSGPARRKKKLNQNKRRVLQNKRTAVQNRNAAFPFNGLTFVLIAFIAVLAVMGVKRISEWKNFRAVKAAVNIDTFYNGTVVDGVDLSGMTLDEADEYWKNSIEPIYENRTVTLDRGEQRTSAELGYSSDYREVLNNAWSAGRSGTIEERYAAITMHGNEGNVHSVHRKQYDDEKVRAFVNEVSDGIDQEPRDAKLENFNMSTYQYDYQQEQTGYLVDREKLVADIEQTLDSGSGTVTLEIEETLPTITLANVASQYGMICEAVTDASSSTSNRLSNIALALSFIHGTVLHPGDTFSFNKVVGERTESRGFKLAPAYVSGAVVDEVGGGICQVSTTLFNAAVKADMAIKERHPHSMTVSYVDPGKDAAVDWGNKDLRFTNESDEDVYICCYLTKNKRVRFGIFGKLLPDGYSIAVKTKKTRKIEYPTVYQVNFTMASGEFKVVQAGKDGAVAKTYKVLLDANGNEVARKELFESQYNPQKQIVEYGQ